MEEKSQHRRAQSQPSRRGQWSTRELSRARVRKYRPQDRDAVRKICYDTGLMGASIDPYFGCMELFADYWMNYYTDYEPESAFVVELGGKVVGYLVGCLDGSAQEKVQRNIITPRIRRKMLTFGYKIDRRFFSFMLRYVRSMWRGEFAEESIKGYPAHLHMNLAEGYRGGGLGSKLLSAFLEYLKQNNVTGLQLGTTTGNKFAVPFYKKWGFQLISSHPLTIYDGIVDEKIEALLFVRKIT